MQIKEINVMRGPNYWSIRRHKLIVMTLDLEELEERPTNAIEGFYDRLKNFIPSLYEHQCSEGVQGGFFLRVKEGTWMGHVIEHIALEIQTLAGMDVGFGRTRSYGEKGVYQVVFAYTEESVGRYAAEAAVRIAEALIDNQPYSLDNDLQKMKELREQERLGPSTASIIDEAVSRGIPWIRLNKQSLCQLGYGACQKRIQATITSQTSSISVELACDKTDTKYLLEQAEIPVPRGRIVRSLEELKEAIDSLGYPLAIKPINGNHGRGITADITSWKTAELAFNEAQQISKSVIVERHIEGEDYRLLVINHKLVAAAKRSPAHVIGNGKDTIQQLIDVINLDPRRGYGHEKVLTAIVVDDMTRGILNAEGYTLDTVLPSGKLLKLKDTANLSTGGTATDVTHKVHPENEFMAERISKIIGLDICGIDVMTTDISLPLSITGGAVLEVNAAPGFRMHLSPTEGLPRNVASPVIDMLYPAGSSFRIPIVAVTGTNGKTTTTRLIAHMMKMHGYKVGYTTTDGIYVNNHLLMKGDCTGPMSTQFVLKDPIVNYAVLEVARGGLLRAGLGFDHCDIGIVTNVSADHLGLKGIHTLEQLARVKSVIPESVHKDGYAILNADDDLVYAMSKQVACQVALFSINEKNPRILEHTKNGGIAAIWENGYITICKGEWKLRVTKAINVPLTFGGKATFMIQNLLPAVLTGVINKFTIEDIRSALESFIPSPSQTPGRLNMFNFKHFRFLLDYAHNPAGLRALQNLIMNLDSSHKVGIITGIGDRRREDTEEVGRIACEMFDEIIIRADRNLRGKTQEEITEMLIAGIHQVDAHKKATVIPSEKEAIDHAINHAQPGSLIVLFSDAISEALAQVMFHKEEEAHKLYSFSEEELQNALGLNDQDLNPVQKPE
ncbi:cyanophycin synthetase [Catalinimonas niigatensis]|uniref:cyanophycin synthetase n=1 Tax=Catalinimonas niigatensis TaxID=1397264 RepID=UPI002666E289|nr:cyanophycin synthetase [Catalinimonas niigatensis]WPP50947.1 cyanophycin synthetase [Catalinimonas niigatensis]